MACKWVHTISYLNHSILFLQHFLNIHLFSLSLIHITSVISYFSLFFFNFSPNLHSNSHKYIGPTFFSSYSPYVPTLLFSLLSFLFSSYHLVRIPFLSLSSLLHQTLYLAVSSSLGSLNKRMMSYHTEITVTFSLLPFPLQNQNVSDFQEIVFL